MAIDATWSMRRQFRRDAGKYEASPFGLVHALCLGYGIDRASQLEFECDLEFADPPGTAAGEFNAPTLRDVLEGNPIFQRAQRAVIMGVMFLCPRCGSPLHIISTNNPKPGDKREMVVHWDKTIKSNVNGHEYPTFSVFGPVMQCDYLTSEISGIQASVDTKCGWMGRIEAGIVYDHSRVRGNLHV